MLKVGRVAFAVACFLGLSDVHECPGHLQMTACVLLASRQLAVIHHTTG